MATLCVESLGPQEYDVDAETARTRLTSAYGEDAAAEICAHLILIDCDRCRRQSSLLAA